LQKFLLSRGGIDLLKDGLTALAKSGVSGLAVLGASAEIIASIGRWAAIPVLALATVWVYVKYPQVKSTVDAAGISAIGTLHGVAIPHVIAVDIARYLQDKKLVEERRLSTSARDAFAGMA
jgi:hypothetical protein